MRPENEWFKPEKLKQYYFVIEGFVLLLVLGVVGILTISGILFEISEWVVFVGGGIGILVFAFLTWWITTFFETADYRLTEDEIEYRRGIFFQQKSTVPYNRITNVNASQGPLQRLVDAGSVGVHTAGYGGQTGAELTIGGVGDYEEIKNQILTKVRGRPTVAAEGDEGVETTNTKQQDPSEPGELFVEVRRVRELLEQSQFANRPR
jgi:membrane protein YdbS with pleckstrin-like domain